MNTSVNVRQQIGTMLHGELPTTKGPGWLNELGTRLSETRRTKRCTRLAAVCDKI